MIDAAALDREVQLTPVKAQLVQYAVEEFVATQLRYGDRSADALSAAWIEAMERYHREEWAFANTGRTDSNLGLAAGDALSEAREAGRRIAAQAVLEQFKRYLAYSCHRALGSSTSVRNIITHIMLLLRQLDRDMAQVMHSSYPAPIFSHEPPVPDPVEALERLRVQLTDILTP